MTPALKWREAFEDLIDAAADEGVFFSQPEIEHCCGFADPPDIEIREMRTGTTEYFKLEW